MATFSTDYSMMSQESIVPWWEASRFFWQWCWHSAGTFHWCQYPSRSTV